MIRVVFDTNTIISGFLFKGNESKLLRIVEVGGLKLYTSKELLCEIQKVLEYPKIQKLLVDAGLSGEEMTGKVSELSQVISPKSKIGFIKEDPEDNRILECAADANAQYIISGDNHLLRLKEYKGIRIIKAKELMDALKND